MKAPGFYVSAIDEERKALVDGPYATHAEALARVDGVRAVWAEKDPRTHFYSWGTAQVHATAKRETFKAARVRLLDELAARGWAIKPDLKTPYIVSPDGLRVEFTAQAVHVGPSKHSLWFETRGATAVDLIAELIAKGYRP